MTLSSYLKSTNMWKNKLFRTNTTNGKILILRIVRTYENIIKEFFMCISINQVSHEKGWKRDGSSETSERMILVWQSDSDKFRLRYRTTEPYSLSLGTTTKKNGVVNWKRVWQFTPGLVSFCQLVTTLGQLGNR